MEIIDSAGMTLDAIFGAPSRNQQEKFKIFLVQLELWGSWMPIRVNLKPDSTNDDFNHKLALVIRCEDASNPPSSSWVSSSRKLTLSLPWKRGIGPKISLSE